MLEQKLGYELGKLRTKLVTDFVALPGTPGCPELE